MKGAIVTKQVRTAGSLVRFEVDDDRYNPQALRQLTKNLALDGTMHLTDWGYPEGNRIISIPNVVLSLTDYETLVAFKESSSYDYLFAYRSDLWQVAIRQVRGRNFGKKRLTLIQLWVVSKYTDMETS